MKPGRELDTLIAEKVMGLKVVHETWNDGKSHEYSIGEPDYWYTADEPGGYLSNPLPKYSTDIAAAWEVVEKIKDYTEIVTIHISNDSESCEVDVYCKEDNVRLGRDKGYSIVAWGEAPPHAICLAALKVVGVEL